MSKDNLDDLLNQLRAKPLPTIPGNMEDRVWREIRARKQSPRHFGYWLDELAARIWTPKFAFGSIAAALVLGVSSPMLLAHATMSAPNSMSRALRLDVFSVEARDLNLMSLGRRG